ncbi:hypothetical protein FISHEDRAFT_35332, partial [Fistulina hepatica ATCC 64428]
SGEQAARPRRSTSPESNGVSIFLVSQSPVGIQSEAIAACESIVERFRVGEISKARALVEIEHHIPYSGEFGDEERLAAHSSAVESFLRKLDGFERIRGRSRRESDDEDEEDVARAGRKIDYTRLPWNTRKQPRTVEASALSPAAVATNARSAPILRTVEILGDINVDLKRAKIDLLLSLDVPQFPESQWTKLLSGGTADFDQVLSGQYASADVERTTERIGGLEFSFVSTAPTKRVTTFGDWTTAFDSFAEAFTFIFPHRGDELRRYADHIKSFFKARPESEHRGVIAYDSAVRTRVGQRRNILHTDFEEFRDLQLRFIFSPAGTSAGTTSRNVESSTSSAAGKRKQSRTPCRNYNNGVCPRSATSCYYAHVCGKCRARGHVEKNCEKK